MKRILQYTKMHEMGIILGLAARWGPEPKYSGAW